MAAPANELQAAIYQALTQDAAVSALVGSRVFDRVPKADDEAPMITIGAASEVADLSDCKDYSDHSITVNAWSESQGGFKEVKEIAFAAKKAVLVAVTSLPTHGLIDIQPEAVRYQRDLDGITSQAILTFTAMIEEN